MNAAIRPDSCTDALPAAPVNGVKTGAAAVLDDPGMELAAAKSMSFAVAIAMGVGLAWDTTIAGAELPDPMDTPGAGIIVGSGRSDVTLFPDSVAATGSAPLGSPVVVLSGTCAPEERTSAGTDMAVITAAGCVWICWAGCVVIEGAETIDSMVVVAGICAALVVTTGPSGAALFWDMWAADAEDSAMGHRVVVDVTNLVTNCLVGLCSGCPATETPSAPSSPTVPAGVTGLGTSVGILVAGEEVES